MDVWTPMICQPYGFMNMHANQVINQRVSLTYIVVQPHSIHHHAVTNIVPETKRRALHLSNNRSCFVQSRHLITA
ncbi:hypothetical protein D3C76_1599450 [compost metagenome]